MSLEELLPPHASTSAAVAPNTATIARRAEHRDSVPEHVAGVIGSEPLAKAAIPAHADARATNSRSRSGSSAWPVAHISAKPGTPASPQTRTVSYITCWRATTTSRRPLRSCEAVGIAEEAQPAGVVVEIGRLLRGRQAIEVQRYEAPGGVCDIPQRGCRCGKVPVDDGQRKSIAIDGVPRCKIVVAHDLTGRRRAGASPPTGIGRAARRFATAS